MKVLIVDDEAPARARLEQILDDLDGFECAGTAANGEEALSLVLTNAPDIVLLDIRMPGLDGIQTANHLNAMERPPAVVFTTAYDEYAIDAFEARAVGYVLKPVRQARLAAALSHARRLAPALLAEIADESGIESQRRHICARRGDQLVLIPIADISVFQADQKYVRVEHDRGKHLIDESLKSLEDEFGDRFVRIHRGALVALARIETIERTRDGKQRIVLRERSHGGGKELIISRRHIAEVRRRLKAG